MILFLPGTKPSFISSLPKKTIFSKDDEFILNCTVESKPVSRIVWQLNNNEITQSDENYRIESNTFQDRVASSLKKKASTNDNGKYTCVAKNDLFAEDEVNSTTNVEVFGKRFKILLWAFLLFCSNPFFLPGLTKAIYKN